MKLFIKQQSVQLCGVHVSYVDMTMVWWYSVVSNGDVAVKCIK